MKRTVSSLVLVLLLAISSGAALAHPGSEDEFGCHTNAETGGYHCH